MSKRLLSVFSGKPPKFDKIFLSLIFEEGLICNAVGNFCNISTSGNVKRAAILRDSQLLYNIPRLAFFGEAIDFKIPQDLAFGDTSRLINDSQINDMTSETNAYCFDTILEYNFGSVLVLKSEKTQRRVSILARPPESLGGVVLNWKTCYTKDL